MNPTDVKLEEVLNGVDDNLQPVEESKNDKPEPTDGGDQPADNPYQDNPNQDSGADVPKPGDTVQPDKSTENDDKGDEEPDEGFTANDVAKTEDTSKDEPSTEEKEQVSDVPKNLDPETQYIVENLPDITTRIKVGDEVKEVTVKSYTQLPENVEFASPRDQLAFLNAMTAQENRAQKLQQDYRDTQQKDQLNDFEQRENATIREDITTLQEANLLPKFKAQPDDPKFAEDPATQEVQKVLDFMNKKNQEYLEKYNNGGTYKHIGFEEAYYMLPETQQKAAQKVAQQQEDKARHEKADRVQGNTGLSNVEIKKPSVPRGTTLDQIVERIEQTW